MSDSPKRQRLSRIATMSWDEIRVRATQEGYKRWDRLQARIPGFTERFTSARFGGRGRFFFQAGDVPGIIDCLRTNLPQISQQIVESADRILRHNFNLLGYEGVDYGREINWHLDGVHGKSSPRLPWYRVRFLDFDLVGDHKVIWELNRHQHLVTLAKAYRLTQNGDYANELFAQWYAWHRDNQYPTGINWASSLEVAFRSLSWLWVWHLLEGTPIVPSKFPFDLHRALMRNGRYIEKFLSKYFAPNTHLIGEAVALLFIGSLAEESRVTLRWQQLGWQIILQEAKRQVLADGMHFEQSTYYHVYALDFFLHARILADINGLAVPSEFDEIVERMLNALRFLGQSGTLPQFGDDDGGRVFDPARNCRNHMLDPIALGAVLFRRPDLKAVSAGVTEELLWLFGNGGLQKFDALTVVEKRSQSTNLAASGICIMTGAGHQQLTLDAGPQGRGWAGHGHADALSVQISIENKRVLVDPGTYSYVNANGYRAHFRSTNSHSTIQIDGVSQAAPSGPFKWANLASAKVERWISREGFDFFAGSHCGYERLVDPVVHQREIFYLKPHFWIVRDVLKGGRPHQIDISWNYAPGLLTAVANRAYFRGRDGALFTALFSATVGVSADVTDGWFSERYGHRESAPILRMSGKVQLPAECATVLLPGIDAKARFATIETNPDQAANKRTRGYRLSLAARSHDIIFSDSTGDWSLGPIASDARFAYCSSSLRTGYDRFAIVDGHCININGRDIFSSCSLVEGKEWRELLPTSLPNSPPFCRQADLLADAVDERRSQNS